MVYILGVPEDRSSRSVGMVKVCVQNEIKMQHFFVKL